MADDRTHRRPLVWRVLRRVLPREYRDLYAEDVLRTHVDAAGSWGAARGVAFWRRVATDVLATTGRLRLDQLRRNRTSEKPRVSMPDRLWYNSRHALRGLARTPSFTAAVVGTLALGLGANATIFTVLDRVLLSPPAHVVNPSEVRRISVYGLSPFSGELAHLRALSYPDYTDLKPVRGFKTVAGYGPQSMTMGQGEESERVASEWATASYFPLLGVSAALGRFYTEEEDRIGAAEPVVVLSWNFWQRRFGGDRSILGRRLNIGKGTYTVSGIAPRGFTGIDLAPVDVWLPLHATGAIQQGPGWQGARRWHWLSGVVRMDPTVPEATTLAEATSRYQAGRAEVPNQDRNAKVVVSSLIQGRGPYASSEAQVTQLLGLVALLVLLIACANVANLFLARGLTRRREFAVQSALGVGRRRLVMQVLAEAVLVSVAAGALALVLASIIRPALFRVLLPEYSLPDGSPVRVVLFTTLLAVLTVVFAGLVPALRAARVDPFEALRTARSSPRSSWLRGALVGAQAALSVILLVGAGLFLRSLREANQVELGLDVDAVVLDIEMTDGSMSGAGVSRAAYAVLERVRSHPAVASATVTTIAPFQGQWGIKVDLPGADSIPAGFNGPFFYTADHDYFRTLGIRVRRGRVFTAADENPASQPVVVVNQSMARTIWKSEEAALGQCLLIPRDRETAPPCTQVVGVVDDVLPSVNATEALQLFYVPPRHSGLQMDGAQTVIVRWNSEPGRPITELAKLAREASPEIRYVAAEPIRASVERQLRAWQMGAALLSAFGLLALIVAGSGLHNVLAFDVAQRRFELGVRAAMGATSRRLIRAVVTRVLAVTLAGIAFGILAATGVTRFAQAMLFRVQPLDPLTYAAAALVLAVCALLAAALPAYRATRIDPRVAMSAD